jgi:hypothetical protein
MSTVGKTVGVIVYGLVAGFAATTVAVLGPMLLALFFVWIFSSLGWQHARDAAVTVISLYVFITGFGLLLGVFVCLRVCITRLRGAPIPPPSPR